MADTEKQAEVKPDPPPYSGLTPARRRFILGLVSTAGFLGPLAGGIYLPALPVLEQDFRVNSIAINATVSVFMLLCAFAALFWSSFSDWKGRRPLYLIALAIYLAANILLAALPANFGALVFLRMVQAFGCSSVITLGAGTVADITEPAKRGFAMSIFLLGPNLGPTIGPVLGGVITGQASWRWTFGFLAIAVGATWITMLFAFPETLRFRVGNGAMYANAPLLIFPPRLVSPLAPESERGPAPPKPSLKTFSRLLRYPPITIAAFYTALLFANYFAMAVGLSDVLVRRYGWSVTAVGGGYLALGVSIVSGSMLAGRFSDWRRARVVARKGPDGKVDPERRLVDQVWGAVVCVAGTVMYGWCVEKNVHPAAVLVATALVGLGMSSVTVVTFAFLTECAPQASAGAMALENMMRNPAAAITAVITPPLVARMGYGWYFTSFAIVVGVVFSSGAFALATWGPEWRKSPAIPPPAPSEESADDSSRADEKVSEP
ncbi:Major facilitator superfamily domain containing protein [Rhypophila decipiens]